ncbi:ABC transporter ATP-binding protein [bacterium]|nr:MAG: ABC transporter ATP-binding protein [bacterium]
MTEKNSKKAVDSNLIRRLYFFIKPYRFLVLLALALTISIAFLGPYRPLLIQRAIDDYVVVGDMEGLKSIILLITAVLLGESLFTVANLYLMNWIGQGTLFRIRTSVFNKIQSLHVQYFDKNPLGRLVTRTTNDIEAIDELVSTGIVNMMGDMLRIVFIMYFMFTMDWKLTLLSLSMIPILFWATSVFKDKMRVTYLEVRDQVARLNSFIQEHINGMHIVQLFNRQKVEFNRYQGINEDHKKAHIKTIYYFSIFWPLVEILSTIGMALVIWFGGASVLIEGLSFGVLVAFIQYVRQFFQPIRDISEKFNTLQSAMAATERIVSVLDTESKMSDGNTELPEHVKGEVEFQQVSFRYLADGQDILKDVSFRLNPGKMMAIVGATGAGKTTIINLMTRFYDNQSGTILLDGIPIKDLSINNLRSQIALVLQDNALFSGSILNNITLGREDISLEKVIEASKLVGAHEFISKLPNAYHHEIHERGASLSMGQRQLICFIRALVFDPKIIILDEATSNIDSETEALVTNALQVLMKDRTSIVIAHRLSTILHADTILVMHKGEVREQGNHKELITKDDGLYRKLYELQYKDELKSTG